MQPHSKTYSVAEVLSLFPESQYPEALEKEFSTLLEGRSWFGASLHIDKWTKNTWTLEMNYYGDETKISIVLHEGKLYAWRTGSGFGQLQYHYGKYLLPAWMQELIAHPEHDAQVRYTDYTL